MNPKTLLKIPVCSPLPILLLLFSWLTPELHAQTDRDLETIRARLLAQQEAWNTGDIEVFMETYWPSDQLLFANANGVTYGWQSTLEGYRRRYPDRNAMGQLTFGIEELRKLTGKTVLLVGTWQLERDDPIGGSFLLVWKKIRGEWLIVADHTAVREN